MPLTVSFSSIASRYVSSLTLLFASLLVTRTVQAAEFDEALKALRVGDHASCIQIADKAIKNRAFGEEFYLLKAEAENQTGEYRAAFDTIVEGLARYSWSIRMRLIGVEAARMSGQSEQASVWQTEIVDFAGRAPWRYSDADNLVALGRAALDAGMDARNVLEKFYDRALKLHPEHRDAMLASGELALAKQDFELAGDIFQASVKKYPDDADLFFGVARSLDRSEPPVAAHALSMTLKNNHRHSSALLYRAENAIDAEQYDEALELLDKVLAINPKHPAAWAYRSVIAHLRNDERGANFFRDGALSTWRENPLVDFLIGRKLSQKYRFTEGAAHQKQALAFQANYGPSRVQLTDDLLRLGREDEGWKLGEAAHKADAYDVHLFNLMQLHDELSKYRTLEADGFLVRMEAKEAAIYGDAVIELLQRAKKTLCEKYGHELKDRITVEIFPEPNDFAVRTFGMPGASGYLGVCFGRVITANSPASQKDHPSNWQAVLWHEFCHVVTLEVTRNRMPRWLSEGISVYEERQADPTWGQRMTAANRTRILKGLMTPIRELSGAFLRPETPSDLNFAYYQSSLVVEYFIERYGLEKLKSVLKELSTGLPIDPALERHLASLDQLDEEFREFAAQMARELAPNLDWEKYDLSAIGDDDDPDRLQRWVADHPTSLQGLTLLSARLIEQREFAKAVPPLKKLIELFPEQIGHDCPYELLAGVHRELKQPDEERRVLEQYATRTDSAVPSLLRLIELESAAEDWTAAHETANRLLAINPLLPQTQRARAAAAEHLNQRPEAIAALEALLQMEPDDPAELHFRLAKLFHAAGDARAKSHILDALEAAPRYRDAQKLLLQIVREKK
jgi:tetratricopeptide (TPR) repeat protein